MQRENEDVILDESEIAEQWVAAGTMPDADETWNVPIEDPDGTVPLKR